MTACLHSYNMGSVSMVASLEGKSLLKSKRIEMTLVSQFSARMTKAHMKEGGQEKLIDEGRDYFLRSPRNLFELLKRSTLKRTQVCRILTY